MAKNLVIVESPAKAKTIEKFLGKEYLVKSSFGHVMDLSKKDLGVDIENGFIPDYQISADKKKIVAELKKLAKDSETVWLATDEDREGEAISWHLINALKLNESKIKRIVFHEITRTAITDAINNPRGIDKNLVNAQTARRVLDRLVGFELSPLLWKKVKPALSAGRVQSVAVRLIVEKEENIKSFNSISTYKITAKFIISKKGKESVIQAELSSRFKTKEQAVVFLRQCKGAEYTIAKIETKPARRSPAPPFTTSTIQQEASRKLGFSVANTMRIAQQLYEAGLITYMRTDSVNLSNMALAMASKKITDLYGKEYVKTRKFKTKSKGAQEAHEAIRPTSLNNPAIDGNHSQKMLYELIWKRTIASQMSDTIMEKTNVYIDISSTKEKFVARGEVIKFDGFLKVYIESTDEEKGEEPKGILPPLKVGDTLDIEIMTATQRFTQAPLRYSEASLVKRMEELGIGRPSTYAPTISTILKREYVVKKNMEGFSRNYQLITLKNDQIKEEVKSEKVGYDKGKLFPTDLGIIVNKFLTQYFETIINYNFTASVEKKFDEIAQGNRVWNEMIKEFYSPFHIKIEDTLGVKKFRGEKLLGKDPESGRNVYVKLGKYGPMVQIGDTEEDEKPRFAGMKKDQSIETITLEEALDLFNFPRQAGNYEEAEMIVAIGRFGPYVKHKNEFFSIPKTDDPSTITEVRAIEIIEDKRKRERERIIKEFDKNKDVKVLKGRYGPYISISKNNFKIPKGTDPASLTLENCLKIAKDPKNTPKKRFTKKGKKS